MGRERQERPVEHAQGAAPPQVGSEPILLVFNDAANVCSLDVTENVKNQFIGRIASRIGFVASGESMGLVTRELLTESDAVPRCRSLEINNVGAAQTPGDIKDVTTD